ncbi:hypothetical protein [Pseudodesulfovibrio tunisiensis]|uniref:hypothetical protein n=1 Tax=Pseudodesulfovibrio tunisiensis TaxID=463192 RepID=UPI001FB1E599|nr:hypothetical protein [Pseudodesulfovibrio tunisiensis]
MNWLLKCVAAGIVGGMVWIGAAGAADVGDAVKRNCTSCHSAKRICLNMGVKDTGAWKGTIARMIGKGARLDPGMTDSAAQYLAGQKRNASPLCN